MRIGDLFILKHSKTYMLITDISNDSVSYAIIEIKDNSTAIRNGYYNSRYSQISPIDWKLIDHR